MIAMQKRRQGFVLVLVVVVVVMVMLAACSDDDEGGGASLKADGNLAAPSSREIEESATADHDGYAVIGCDYVLRVNSGILLNQSNGEAAPFRDIGVTLDTLRQSTTLGPLVQDYIADAGGADTAPELNTALLDIDGWCTSEGPLPE